MATTPTDVLDAVDELASHILEEGADGNEDERDELRQSVVEVAQNCFYSGGEPDELMIETLNGSSEVKAVVQHGRVYLEMPEQDDEEGIRYVSTPIPPPGED